MERTIHTKSMFVIEDDGVLRLIYEHWLSKEGYSVRSFKDIASARDAILSSIATCDGIILDLIMPVIGKYKMETTEWHRIGIVLYREVRQLSKIIPVFILSILADSELAQELKNDANVYIMQKRDFPPEQVVACIKEIVPVGPRRA